MLKFAETDADLPLQERDIPLQEGVWLDYSMLSNPMRSQKGCVLPEDSVHCLFARFHLKYTVRYNQGKGL